MTSTNQNKKTFMTQAEFARFRGVSRATVTGYKKKGLLVLNADDLVVVDATIAKLDTTLDPVRGGDRSGGAKKPAAGGGELVTQKARELEVKTARAELLLRKDAGELVAKELVETAAFTLARQAQESLISIPDRLASLLAAESDPAKVHDMLSEEIRRVANDLADHAEGMFK